ncbi:MAG TPA: N-acetylmuramoyl-L-alanine amidase [Candidatus Acidoferrum sp.]|nr:N-acetylmuramoyl-L-alanine amidase [Candidatus Acidoferrum sp.]
MNRSRVRVSSCIALALGLALVAYGGAAGAQQSTPLLWFQGTRLVLEHAVPTSGDLAVSIADDGMRRFLDKLGATVSYDPSQRYVVVTAQDRRTIVFTLRDPGFTVAGVGSRAPFAPFLEGGAPVLPFFALARALYVEPVADGGETVLQPRIGALDVRTDGPRTVVTVRAAMPLVTTTNADTPDRLQVSFLGQGSSLAPQRNAPGPTVQTIGVTVSGTPRVPTTMLTIAGPPGTTHRIVPGGSPAAFTVVFEPLQAGYAGPPTPPPPAAAPLPGAPALPGGPAPEAYPAPTAAPPVVAGRTTVTDLTIAQADADALGVTVALSGAANYEWHRLADHRWYVDFQNTTLTGPGRDERPQFGAVESVRVRQIGSSDAPVVRVAFTFIGDQRVDLTPSESGLTITVGATQTTDLTRIGFGHTGGAPVVASSVGPEPLSTEGPWKFGGPVPGANSRLIVIDPGHGGADTGAAHNGLLEKNITFDIAQRLRALLLAQGWQVRLTRDSDIDPVSNDNLVKMRGDGRPNPDDRAYLQTRCDVANLAGARLFISIHVNSAPVTSANGTTFFWYKPQDAAFAQALERAVIPAAGTQDDGARHENFYVVRHTTMPAVLIETAFLTNPGDVALLRQSSFLQNMAQGIANGVKAYTGAPPLGAVTGE